MSSRKRILITLTSAVTAIGLVGILTPFFLSLSPTRFPTERSLEISTSDLGSYSSKIVHLSNSEKRETSRSTEWITGSAVIIFQREIGDVSAFLVPTWDGAVVMPEKYWGQHGGYCSDFLADFELDHDFKLRCEPQDEWVGAYRSESWYWSLDGENISGELPDLMNINYHAVDGRLFVAWSDQ